MDSIGRVEIERGRDLRLWLRLRKTNCAFAFFPLAALLEKLNALKSLEHRTLSAGSARCLE